MLLDIQEDRAYTVQDAADFLSTTVKDKMRLVTSNCPDDKLIIGDFQHYAMGIRNRISVEATTVGGDAFADHQIWIKVWARVAYVPLDLSAFNVLSGITSYVHERERDAGSS